MGNAHASELSIPHSLPQKDIVQIEGHFDKLNRKIIPHGDLPGRGTLIVHIIELTGNDGEPLSFALHSKAKQPCNIAVKVAKQVHAVEVTKDKSMSFVVWDAMPTTLELTLYGQDRGSILASASVSLATSLTLGKHDLTVPIVGIKGNQIGYIRLDLSVSRDRDILSHQNRIFGVAKRSDDM